MGLYCVGFMKRQCRGSERWEVKIDRCDGSSKSKWLCERDADNCYSQLSAQSNGSPLDWSKAVMTLNSFDVE
jgi:hypothetical protein